MNATFAQPTSQKQKTPPKKMMPPGRMGMMVGTAVVFDSLQILLTLSFIFFPLVLGVASAGAASGAAADSCSSVLGPNEFCTLIGSFAGSVAGVVAVVGAAATSALAGGAIAAAGNILASMVSVVAFLLFFLWFTLSGVTFFGSSRATKRYGARIAQGILDSLPFLSLFPFIALSVWFVCREARAEDKENESRFLAETKNQERARQSRVQMLMNVVPFEPRSTKGKRSPTTKTEPLSEENQYADAA